ncbi:MAG: head-tail connector protein, partial [Puniceicoccales bacterium]|nr:head-tail connector protein [Puniceicoccales bacterium]
MELDFKTLRRKHLRAVAEAKPFWEAYRRAAEYAAPSINTFCQSKGSTKSPGVNTSQALQSTNAFICEFISALTPPNRRWAELQPTTALVEEIARQNSASDEHAIRSALDVTYETITKKFFECLDSSNFYDVLKQFVLSIGIGTGCMLMNELDYGRGAGNAVPFEFIYVPVSNLSLDAGNNNRIYGVFRDMRVRREEIPELWFDGDASGLEEKEEYNLVECCVYAPQRVGDMHPWVFCVFDSDEDVKVVQDRRLAYNPYIVFRWSTVEGESLGRGPILEAMADIKSLNRLWETYFAWVQRNSLGMTLVKNSELAYTNLSNFENFDLKPGTLIPVNDPASYVPLKISGEL